MESCALVSKEVEKVISKFQLLQNQGSRGIEECLNDLLAIEKDLSEENPNAEVNPAHSLLLNAWLKKARDTASRLSSDHKDLHSGVSRIGKTIDKNFVCDFRSVISDDALQSPSCHNDINHVICEHFLRQGMLDIANSLIQESTLSVEDAEQEPFLELHRILEALKQKEISPALRWVEENRDKLDLQNSSLDFKLHRMQFIELVRQGPARQQEALHYARQFAAFAHSHRKEIQSLMGTLLYMPQGLENSPYAHLLDPIHLVDLADLFTRDACTLLGLSVESPLTVVVRAGCAALPPLLNIRQVMQQRGVFATKDELPVEVELGADCRFHSVFACPILRQQTTESNPPMRLVCGHVISRDALNKLATSSKVKCPYCPLEHDPADARQIYF